MRIDRIEFVPDDEWLVAEIGIVQRTHPVILQVKRNVWGWSIRKQRGQATLAFRLKPSRRYFYQADLPFLVEELRQHELLRIGPAGQLVFQDGPEAQPTVHFEPQDVHPDESLDTIRYSNADDLMRITNG